MYSCALSTRGLPQPAVLKASLPQVVSQMNPTTGKLYHASVNACLAPLVSIDGKHVITVEVGRLDMISPRPLKHFSGYWKYEESPSRSTKNCYG